jgi:SAM-dependent methyltransferase
MADERTGAAKARYNGIAEWYDAYNARSAELNAAELAALLGRGSGLCLDLGCGTGQYFEAIRATGRTPVGLDYSADQLRLAAPRHDKLVQADAAALPFADNTFPTVAIMWLSTDVDDFGAVVKEASRVLQPNGLVTFYGVHPCFNGPCVQGREGGGLIVHPTYRVAGWHEPAPWWKPDGIRRRTGMRHLPLMDLVNAFVEAGLTIERMVEPGGQPVPSALGIRGRAK